MSIPRLIEQARHLLQGRGRRPAHGPALALGEVDLGSAGGSGIFEAIARDFCASTEGRR